MGLFPSRIQKRTAAGISVCFCGNTICYNKDIATELSRIFSALGAHAAKNWGQPWRKRV